MSRVLAGLEEGEIQLAHPNPRKPTWDYPAVDRATKRSALESFIFKYFTNQHNLIVIDIYVLKDKQVLLNIFVEILRFIGF